MSISNPTGILDVTNAIMRVSKLEFRGATGFDTILNNVARNTILLVDQNVEYTTSNAWALKLPNAWVAEFEGYWGSGASGNLQFNFYNDTTSGTNGYMVTMDDTTVTLAYDGGSALETVTLGSTLKNDTWHKIDVFFERDMVSVAVDGKPVLYHKDTVLRPRVYDDASGYINFFNGGETTRKFKNLKVVNGDKWITDGTSNIAYMHGNVGIGTTQAAHTLDVHGDIRATGNLLIEGLTTTVDTQNLSIEDAIVEIGRGNDGGTSGKDVGFLFTRNNGANTTNSNVALIYDESTDRLTLGYSDGSPTASTLAINTSKSLDVVIPSGNLGVGTASPDYPLHVVGDVAISGGTSNYNNSFRGGYNNRMNINMNLDPDTPDCDRMTISLHDDECIRIRRNYNSGINSSIFFGNVGIGSASPVYKLDVASVGNTSTSTVNHQALRLYNDNFDFDDTIELLFKHGSNTNQGQAKILSYLPGGNDVGLKFFTTNSTTLSSIPVLTLTGNQTVGIGTASPKAMTHIGKLSANSGTHNTIPTANIGVSANFPDSTNLWLGKRSAAQPEDYWGMALGTVYDGNSYIQTLDKSNQYFYNLLLQPNGGNVGIGTASPGAALHVHGSENTSDTSISMCVDRWKTKTWYGTCNYDGGTNYTFVTLIDRSARGSANGGQIAGEVTVVVHRDGYNQQNAYAKYHVNYTHWGGTTWYGTVNEIANYNTSGVSDILVGINNTSGIVFVRITSSANAVVGQYYVKFDGPVYDP